VNRKLRVLAWPAYAVAFLLIAVPLANIAPALFPFDIAVVQWRFRVAGIVAGAIPLPILGVFLAAATAELLGHFRTARVIAVFSFLCSAIGLLAAVMFALDSIQLRPEVRVEVLPSFDASFIAGLAKFGIGAIVAAILGVGSWKAGRRPPGGATRGRGTSHRERDHEVLIDTPRS
jgi:hypothetical protein